MNAYFNLLLKKFYAFSKHLKYFLFCFWFFLHVISAFKTLEETVFIWQEAIKICFEAFVYFGGCILA